MSDHRLMIVSLALGLAVWAMVLWMRANPATDLAHLQVPVTQKAVRTIPGSSAAELYAAACAGCHRNEGEGRFPVFPPLAGSPWVNGDPDRLVAVTLHGLSGPIEVNGVGYGGLMPGFRHLDDSEIAKVLSHVRSSWGNDASPLTTAEVAAMRAQTAWRRSSWTMAELEAADIRRR